MNEAELLFSEIFKCQRVSLYLNEGLRLNRTRCRIISSVLKRRILGEPIDYIMGKTEFMGLEFKVTQDVFIPRPETEILLEIAIEIGRGSSMIGHKLKVLDIGTGCGNIAISMAKFLPHSEVHAIDVSSAALEVAKFNAIHNKVKVNFIQSDLFNAYSLQLTVYSLILSNPPYISSEEISNLQPELSYEPRTALDGGKDGLDFYRTIIKKSKYYLEEKGYLIMEIGFAKKRAVENIIQSSGNFQVKEVVKDYSNIDRVIVAGRV